MKKKIADFHGANAPTMADFKLPMSLDIKMGKDVNNRLSYASASQLQQMIATDFKSQG